jgi:hypothetical protein
MAKKQEKSFEVFEYGESPETQRNRHSAAARLPL